MKKALLALAALVLGTASLIMVTTGNDDSDVVVRPIPFPEQSGKDWRGPIITSQLQPYVACLRPDGSVSHLVPNPMLQAVTDDDQPGVC